MYNTIYLMTMDNSKDIINAAKYKSIMDEFKFSRDKIVSELANKINTLVHTNKTEFSPPTQCDIDREVKLLIDNLPTTFSGSILIRQNSKSHRIFSALIMGVENTPYDSACILFEIFLPDGYPTIPLKIKCMTPSTYGKFNPSINNNGDVTMALLGTYGCTGNTCEGKWNPNESSIYQVLFSIQNLMFTCDPYFNDPAKDTFRNSAWGKKESKQYNQKVRLMVVADCMYKMLKDPPPEFADAIKYHFLVKRNYIKQVLKEWNASIDVTSHNSTVTPDYLSYQNKTLFEWIKLTTSLLEELDATDQFKDSFGSDNFSSTDLNTEDPFNFDTDANPFGTDTDPFNTDPFGTNTDPFASLNPLNQNTLSKPEQFYSQPELSMFGL